MQDEPFNHYGRPTTIQFLPDGRFEGWIACNTYYGKYELWGQSLKILSLGQSLLGCVDLRGQNIRSNSFVYALISASSYELHDNNQRLRLKYGSGDQWLEFVR